MKAIKYRPPQSRLEPIPDKEKIELINRHSFKFIDSEGKEQIQRIDEFEEENKFINRENLFRNKREIEVLSLFLKSRRTAFQFFQTPVSVVWDQYQTDIRHQKDRNTCSGFAMVAAIEARYMRDYGLNLNLSEQFFWHCYKSTGLSHPKIFKYENQSSYWGGGNSHGIREAVNFSIPLEDDCPYLDKHEMQSLRNRIPEAGLLNWRGEPEENTVTQEEVDAFEYSPLYISDKARQNAKYGVKSFLILNGDEVRNPSSLERYLAWGYEVIVDAHLRWKIDPSTGILGYDPDVQGGSHVFLIVGYDREDQIFYIKNSWGERGFIRVSYEFAQNCFILGSIVTEVTHPDRPTKKSRALGRWKMNHDGWSGELVIRRFTNANNDITRLGHYRSNDGFVKAVNGNFIHEGQGLKFFLTENEDTEPSSQEGQLFTVDVFSWNIKHAAGDTEWNGIPYGAYMSRDRFSSAHGRSFDPTKWKGRWLMNHDGWQGTLTLSRIMTLPLLGWMVQGEYQPANGTAKTIFGFIDRQRPHILRFSISFSNDNNQPFVLHFHTWSADLASGYTHWNGQRFGAFAFKR